MKNVTNVDSVVHDVNIQAHVALRTRTSRERVKSGSIVVDVASFTIIIAYNYEKYHLYTDFNT